ncbi:MAG: CHAD domain-containing protein [Acidobacteriia bacterium]|nr:CHAD domain-containing protein [Terriglobia bacterium]
MHAAATAGKKPEQQAGLAFWMQRVLEECDRASVDFAPDPVHDLRVALRRCRSMADGLMAIHPDPAWKEMKKAGKRVFSSLGELRDVQVIEEWVGKLGDVSDPAASVLLRYLASREVQLKAEAAQALKAFDRKQWVRWSSHLPRRAARVKQGNAIFKHLALERWVEAHELHRRALRNRSQVSFHRLRIGLKRFRYIVENFLPQQHHAWRDDLKELQDILGEVHDLDVLWATALQIHAFPDAEARARWQARVREERDRRIAKYREKMVGKGSLWSGWRAELPQGEEIKSVALQRLMLWASNLDPDFKHSNHVARLALQLYDGLAGNGVPPEPAGADLRGILRVAALLHDVGRSKHEKGRHKASYRLIRRLASPLGWNKESLRIAGIIARYHRGALPRPGQKALRGLSPGQRQSVLQLAGMLRLADAFDIPRDGRIQRLDVRHENGFVVIGARGYSPRDRRAEAIAGARHLLEVVCRRPVIVQPLRPPRKPVASN